MTRDHANVGQVLAAPPPEFTPDEARLVALEHYGVTGHAGALYSERDQNFHLRADDGREFVLKIANPAEQRDVLEFQTAALRHIASQSPDLPVPGICVGIDGKDLHDVERDQQRYLVRLVTYLPGIMLDDVPQTPAVRRSVGGVLARLDRALSGFFHPAAGHELLWDLARASGLRPLLEHVEDESGRRLIAVVLDHFDTRVQRALASLRAQVIHSDFNRDNLLVAPDDPDRISGIIDFGDMVHGPLVNDLAVAVAYQIIDEDNQPDAAIDVVGAYHAVMPLAPDEIALIYDLVAARMTQSLCIGSWRATAYPERGGPILEGLTRYRTALERWHALDRAEVTESFRLACGFVGASHGAVVEALDDALTERRRRHLGTALRLSYASPLHIVRGEGVWLFDRDGRRYLDAYNNVACVGHCHPAVSAALARQTATLNTNTRYLHEHIVEYAERLTNTLPPDLSVCMFVCSGTEANDLAWQIAQACSGGTGAIVTDNAYHGNSTAVSQLSPEELAPELRQDWVATVPAPNVYSGPHRADEADPGPCYAAHLDAAIATLRRAGHNLAAFLVDTVYTSDGIFMAPDGYLAAAWQRVRDAGGLCIADEVQAGFGRTGQFLWGFQQQGVVPDIVTLGKPIGNGHPLAAVVTTPDIAERFAASRYYFNTFGGNPVSCAVGLAVLDVLQRERLQDNAWVVGDRLRACIDRLRRRHPVIGDVRGAGLLVGVELVQDHATREPAAEACTFVMNRMREHGVLIGRTGLAGHVLKIRPPLVFSRANADLLLETLDESLSAIGT